MGQINIQKKENKAVQKKKTPKIDIKYNLTVYSKFLFRYKLIIIAIILTIAFISAVQVANRYLFKIVIDRGTDFVNGALSYREYSNILFILVFIFIAVTFVEFINNWIRIHLINRLEGNVILDLKKKYFNHILGLHYGFHTTHRTGSLISKLVRIGGSVERMTDAFIFSFAPLIFQLIAVVISLIYFDIASAVIVIATAVAFLLYGLYLNNIEQEANMAANDAEDFEKANISDILTNIDSIKYFGKEENIKSRYAGLCENTKEKTLRYWDFYRWFDSGQSVILGIGTLFVVVVPLVGFFNGRHTIGDLVFIYTMFTSLFGPLFSFLHGIRGFYRAMADFESLFKYGKMQNEIKDKTDAKKLVVRSGTIDFKNVSFSYSQKRKVLSHFSLSIPQNAKVAFVGRSGSGKTTLVKLLYRLYDIDDGEILIDGKNIKEFRQESLRSELSVVPQECVLFDDTIYNNIKFSMPRAAYSDVLKAMKLAQLKHIVDHFPEREKTIVGERGVRLSGGEKQRVSIARAILADKKILVLDEATSALDSKTEAQIQYALERLMQGRTCIIIAHRLSTIMKADMIVVMDKGRIVQKGTHNELIKQPGLYRKLWNLQKGGYIK